MAKARKNFSGAAAKHGIPREEGMQFIDDAMMGNLEGVIQFIDKYGKDGLEVRDRDWAPKGQSVWKTNRKTALFHATWEKRKDVVEFLIAQGANVNGRDRRGYTPLFMSREPVMAGILLDAGADVNAKCDDGTPIMFPTTAQMIHFLVSRGADINAFDKEGKTALMCAAQGRHMREEATVLGNLHALLDAGADPDARDKQGRTALMHAALFAVYDQSGDEGGASMLEVVTLLLARGADPELRDNEGNTAETIARRACPHLPNANIVQQNAVGDILAEAVAERREKAIQLFTEGPRQAIGVMKPLQLKR